MKSILPAIFARCALVLLVIRLTPCPAASIDESITVTDTANGTINPNFLGFHYEKDIMSGTMFRASNVNLIKLYKLLGTNGILRIGGNLVDTTSWGGQGEAGSGRSRKLIMSGDVDEFSAFVKATGWKVIYGVNAKSAPVGTSVDEARYAVSKLGAHLYGLEYGNEPDRMGVEAYESKWNEFYTTLGTIAPYTGPGTAQGEWVNQFAKDEGKRIILLTRHYYIGSGKNGPTVDEMLASQDPGSASRAKLEKICQAMTASANNYVPGGKWFFAEANNYFGGGSSGESCKFGSALWVIEFLFDVAQNGCAGVSIVNDVFRNNTNGYAPLYCGNDNGGTVLEVRPEFYGLLLWSKIQDGTIQTTTQTGSAGPGFHSYAVRHKDGSCSVVLVNNSRTETVAATIQLPIAFTSAASMELTAPSIDTTDRAAITLSGSRVSEDGTWNPQATKVALSRGGKSFALNVKSGSALWVKLSPVTPAMTE